MGVTSFSRESRTAFKVSRFAVMSELLLDFTQNLNVAEVQKRGGHLLINSTSSP